MSIPADTVIRVRGLGKSYRLGTQGPAYLTLREAIHGFLLAPLQGLRRKQNRRQDGGSKALWALRDLDLDIRRGEIVGVIGPNGAGRLLY